MAKKGRPEHVPTEILRDRVQTLSGFGLDQERIAASLGIGAKTLVKHYRKELDNGTPNLIEIAAGSLMKVMLSKKVSMPRVTAAIFMLKARGGYRDQHQKIEHSGPDGNSLNGPVVNNTVLYLPDNGRDPVIAPPMKTINGKSKVLLSIAPPDGAE